MTVIDMHYRVDVTVAVDIDDGTVTKVIVWDDELRELDSGTFDPDVTGDQRRRAAEVCEAAPWPAWQFGC